MSKGGGKEGVKGLERLPGGEKNGKREPSH